ncbi:MAG: Rpn family recombination-promoting nuclease/putative transposase, partial [Leptonema sp. (in: Bacteria)]|nr:Rpn family recombination-promoting nuclease/putative transposase [Leptonema sp. (in: bacteria)]
MEKIADRIIRDTLSEIDEAVGFTLPTKIVKILNFDTLKSAQTTFISEALKEYRTDLLFQIQTVDRSPAQIFILFEHKSNQDPKVFSQLLSYLAQVYASQTKPMPVIPFVFCHGKQGWKLGSQFVDWFKFSEQQRQLYLKYLPNFSFEI